mmetsp:Transcript_85964/g.227914  ORF Transcript_85964/g.227914 Transcript_85964/m.227914 type:complete len:395 (+) Transcript_85964:98-1282(+)
MPRSRQDAGCLPACRAAAEAQRDALLPLFGASDLARSVLGRLQEEGYAVLPGVLSRSEADQELDRMWSFVEAVSPTVSRRVPRSWHRQGGGGPDPWPHAQRDMMQLHQAGWVFGGLRETLAERVFEPLYGTRELHCSKDGFTFQRPTREQLSTTPNDHFDQGSTLLGLQCVQGSVALTDQDENDGCFLCWPGSHEYRERILASKGQKGARDFVILTDADKDVLRAAGIAPRRVPVCKGDVILFRSDLCHCGASPIGARPGFRAVVYVCCLPASLTPESTYPEKLRAYEQLETGSHWPTREEWFVAQRRHEALAVRPFFRAPPELTVRQQELYGLQRYEQAPRAPLSVATPAKAKRRWQRPRALAGQAGKPAAGAEPPELEPGGAASAGRLGAAR